MNWLGGILIAWGLLAVAIVTVAGISALFATWGIGG
jgi:hypothetical protein